MAQLTKFEIEMFAKRAAQEFIEHNRDMDDAIFEYAGANDLNREQIKRVVEAANTMANGELVKRAKASGGDPRVSFKLADSTRVFSRMIAESPEAKVAHERKVSTLSAMFVVPETKPQREKVASAPRAKMSEMSGPELAAAYVRGENVEGQMFTVGQLADACDDLARLQAVSSEKWAALAEAEESVLRDLARAVDDELHSGTSPATIKAAAARSPACDFHIKAACDVVAARAREMERAEGVNKIAAHTIVDERSPVIVDTCALMLIDAARDAVLMASEKVADAQARAHGDLMSAHAAGTDKVAMNLSTVSRGVGSVGRTAKGIGGAAIGALGVGMGAMEAKSRAQQATQRLKQMQMTPAVGPLKMASEKLAGLGAYAMGHSIAGGGGGLDPSVTNVLKTLGIAAGLTAAAGVGLKGLDALTSAVSAPFERRRRDKLFEQLLTRDPALKNMPRAREYFDLVMTYAPALGDHPTAIGDFLKKQMQYPATSVEFLSGLAKLQKDISDSRRMGPNAIEESVHSTIGGAQRKWLGGN